MRWPRPDHVGRVAGGMSRVELVEVADELDAPEADVAGVGAPEADVAGADVADAGAARAGAAEAGRTHAPPDHPRARRAVRYAALVGAAALVAGLVAQSARNQTREAQIAGLPGLVRTSGAGLRELWTIDPGQAQAVLHGVVVGGTLVGPLEDEAGEAVGVAGTDPDTGRRLWTAEPPWLSWGVERPLWVECGRAGALATCLAEGGSGYLAWSLDPATGRTVTARELPSEVATALVDGRVWVLAGFDTAGRQRLVWNEPDRLRMSVLDLATGGEAWAWDGPPGFVGAPWSASIVGDGSLILRGERGWLLGPDGAVRTIEVRPTVGAFAAGRVAALIQTLLSPRTPGRLLTAGGAWRDVPGQPLPLAVDDGSAPGMEFLRGGWAVGGAGARGADTGGRAAAGGTVAVSGRTGDERWRLATGADHAALLDGRLYLASDGHLSAVDAQTGAPLWSAATDDGVTGIGTDGYAVLVASRQAVEAFGLSDGRRLWRTDVVTLLRGAGAQWAGERVRLDTGVPHVVVTRRDGSAVVLG